MSVIRGKFFTDREMVPSGKTVGKWPFKESGEHGTWIKQGTNEEFELKSLQELLKREEIDEESVTLQAGTIG
jgi:hypothetical protein